MLLGFLNHLVFDCGMSVVLIKNDDDDDDDDIFFFLSFIVRSLVSFVSRFVSFSFTTATMYDAPVQVMDKYLEPLVLRAGTSAAVEVPFAGSPQPKVTWMIGGQVLRDVRRVRVETIYNLTTLVISRAERSDAGTYTLSLENQLGTSNLTVQVIVLGKIISQIQCLDTLFITMETKSLKA